MGILRTLMKTAATALAAAVIITSAGRPVECRPAEAGIEALNIPLFRVEGESWITLPDLAFLLDGRLARNPVSRRTEITFRGNRVVFRPESSRVLFNDTVTEMSAPARLVNGVEAVPSGFAALLADPGFQPVPAKAAAPGEKTPPGEPGEEPNLMDLLSRALHPGLDDIIAEAVRKEDVVIVIDPGHGGKDAGAVGPYGLTEKAVVLDISLRMKDYLERKHPKARLIMTRTEDVFVSLEERVRIANDAQADIFVSVHANAARLNRYLASGFETFYSRQKPAGDMPAAARGEAFASVPEPWTPRHSVAKSRYLASLMQEELSDIFIEEIPNRGVKGRGFYVLRYTFMPSVLVEVGFISNPNIELNLRQPGVRQRIAEALGHAVSAYLEGRALRPEEHVDTPLVQALPDHGDVPPGH